MPTLDDLKNPVALGAIGVVILGIGLAVTLKLKADESDAAGLIRRHAAEARSAEAAATGQPHAASTQSRSAYDESQGFVVPYRPDCPHGTQRQGGEPPKAFKEWCARVGKSAGVKHGWYAEWFPDGRPAVAGEYEDGLRVGVWTRWYPNGKKRVQAEFKQGLQEGRLISWTERGAKQGEQHFAQGVVVPTGG